jgi:hypothetical protein
MEKEEYFGDGDQQALLKRGRALSELLKHDKRFSYYGRTVGIATMEDGDLDTLTALARVQGNSNCATVPEGECQTYASALKARGLNPVVYNKWEVSEAPLKAARGIVDTVPHPVDVTLVCVTPETPLRVLDSAAQMALACGVLPTCGAALRGLLQPSVTFLALDQTENVVSIAAASAYAHPDHASLSGQAWWGMLATHPSRRGQSMALVLGAHAILELERRFGFRSFMTGVEAGNAPSEAVSSKMGLAPEGMTIVGCADPKALSGGRMTK